LLLIRSLAEKDYPPGEFQFEHETYLKVRGSRMAPDITIRNAAGEIVCLIEIGYTRPEKLTVYRDILRIQDVRWYDKQGVLHESPTIKREVVVRQERIEYSIADEIPVRCFPVKAACEQCCDDLYEELRAEGGEDGILNFNELEEGEEDIAAGTDAYIVFTPTHWIGLYGCDVCDRFGYSSSEFFGPFALDETYDSLFREWHAHRLGHRTYPSSLMLSLDTSKRSFLEVSAEWKSFSGEDLDYSKFLELQRTNVTIRRG